MSGINTVDGIQMRPIYILCLIGICMGCSAEQDGHPGQDGHMDVIAWGKGLNGIQIGLRTDRLEYDVKEPTRIDIWARNTGKAEAEITIVHSSVYGWDLIYADNKRSHKYFLRNHRDTMSKFLPEKILLAAGEKKKLVSFASDCYSWRYLKVGEPLTLESGLRSLPSGDYTLTVVHQGSKLTSGRVAIRIK